MMLIAIPFIFVMNVRTYCATMNDSPPTTLNGANGIAMHPESRMEWFRDAKFGLFLHWGIYSVPAGQWGTKTNLSEWFQAQTHMSAVIYSKYAAQFNPTNFNASQWVDIAKAAGVKYIVITAKHHDGFCMFDITNTDYNIVNATPYAHDPMKDLAMACRDGGIQLGFFYSLPDWHHPDMPPQYNQKFFHGNPGTNADFSRYVAYMHNQIKELLLNYGPLGMLWFDGGSAMRGAGRPELIKADELLAMIHEIQPACLVNDRLGRGKDYNTDERVIPGAYPGSDFEVCMPLNDHWSYNSADHNWKSARTVIRNLVDIASKGGNYLLDVGPTADGSLPPAAIEILKETGKWLKDSGDSIYGTGRSPWLDVPPWGRITAKDNEIFVHIFVRPPDGIIRLTGLKTKPTSISFLSEVRGGGAMTASPQDGDMLVQLAEVLPNPIDSVVVLRFNQTPEITGLSLPQAK